MLAVYTLSVSFAPGASVLPGSRVVSRNAALSMEVKPVVIGVAADSGCGKSTFMRRPRAFTRVEHREKRRAST